MNSFQRVLKHNQGDVMVADLPKSDLSATAPISKLFRGVAQSLSPRRFSKGDGNALLWWWCLLDVQGLLIRIFGYPSTPARDVVAHTFSRFTGSALPPQLRESQLVDPLRFAFEWA